MQKIEFEMIKKKEYRETDFSLSIGLSILLHVFLLAFILFSKQMIFTTKAAVHDPVANSLKFFIEQELTNSLNEKTSISSQQNASLDKESIAKPKTEESAAAIPNPFAKADTSSLAQMYAENTLQVKMKFPAGWTYIDQNVKKKLDGVTFYADPRISSPPPYVHLEVVDKFYFNPTRYKYHANTSKCSYFFNDPEELEGTYSQSIYIKTEQKEDFEIKVMIKGKDAFYRFLPSFWGIVQSFDFGSSIF